jgi:CubicO group peptidase (beta-lactamase class C family)
VTDFSRLATVCHELCQPWAGRSPGLGVAVAQGDRLVFEAAYGLADLGRGEQMTPTTIVYAGSLAKQFTAALVLMAAADGKLSLLDPIGLWLPELPAYATGVVVDDLLHHTAGLRDYFGYRSLLGTAPGADYGPEALLNDLSCQSRLNFLPGEGFCYSNTNYVLAALVVERATGTGFADYAQERIFGPLGMTGSQFRVRSRPPGPGVARAYQRSEDGSWAEDDPLLGVVGDGGLRTSAVDLARWASMSMSRFFGPALLAGLSERGRLSDGRTLAYGRGLGHRSRGGRQCLQHGGGLGAWRTTLLWFPDDLVAVAVVANAGDVGPLAVALGMADVVLPGVGTLSQPVVAHPPDPLFSGLWHDESLGVVLRVEAGEAATTVAIERRQFALVGDSDGTAVVPELGLRLVPENVDGLVVLDASEGGNPWGRFRRAGPWGQEDLAGFTGTYHCPELPIEWELTEIERAILVRHLPLERFEPAAAGVINSRNTYLHFSSDRLRVGTYRCFGFDFERVA